MGHQAAMGHKDLCFSTDVLIDAQIDRLLSGRILLDREEFRNECRAKIP